MHPHLVHITHSTSKMEEQPEAKEEERGSQTPPFYSPRPTNHTAALAQTSRALNRPRS